MRLFHRLTLKNIWLWDVIYLLNTVLSSASISFLKLCKLWLLGVRRVWRSRSPIFISQHTFVFWACSGTIESCSSVLKKLISGHSSPSLCVCDLQITYRKRKNPFSPKLLLFDFFFFRWNFLGDWPKKSQNH